MHIDVDIVLTFLEFDYGTATSKMVETIPPQIEADVKETNPGRMWPALYSMLGQWC